MRCIWRQARSMPRSRHSTGRCRGAPASSGRFRPCRWFEGAGVLRWQALNVSVPTLRDMERGAPTVQIGTWINALWALDRLEELALVLAERANLLDRAREAARPQRKRAYAKRKVQK